MITGMRLSTSSQCVKYLMFIFNLIFVITGIILLSTGLVIHRVYDVYDHFLDDKFLSVPSLLIAIGVIIFFIAFFGCCGALRENYCMLLTFSTLLVLVFIMELSGGISGYILRAQAGKIVKTKMQDTMKDYNNTNVALVWDTMQGDFSCCGTMNMTDWQELFNNSTDLPISCCPDKTGMIGRVTCTTDSADVFKEGCFPKFLVYVKSHAMQLGGFGIGIAFVQAIGIWFSIYLARSIRNSYESV